MTFQVSLPAAKYGGPVRSWAFYKSLLESLESLPGVKAAAVSSGIPFGSGKLHDDSGHDTRKTGAGSGGLARS